MEKKPYELEGIEKEGRGGGGVSPSKKKIHLLNVVPTIENAVSAGSENNNEIKKYCTVGKLQRIVLNVLYNCLNPALNKVCPFGMFANAGRSFI